MEEKGGIIIPLPPFIKRAGRIDMPVKMHHTIEGWYFQWGEHGKKYFFDPDDPSSKSRAKSNAERQGRAAFAHGYRGK